MKVTTTSNLKIKLSGSDAANFKSAVGKLADEFKKIGFKQSTLTDDEVKVINQLSENITNKK